MEFREMCANFIYDAAAEDNARIRAALGPLLLPPLAAIVAEYRWIDDAVVGVAIERGLAGRDAKTAESMVAWYVLYSAPMAGGGRMFDIMFDNVMTRDAIARIHMGDVAGIEAIGAHLICRFGTRRPIGGDTRKLVGHGAQI